MNKFSLVLSAIAAGFILLILIFFFDYSDFSWKNNVSNYVGIIAALAMIISNLGSNFSESKSLSQREK